jgi:N-acyl homoserine lactone hydrolase
MTRIHVLQTGSTLVSPAMPDRSSRKTDLAFTGLFQKRSDRISVPVKCFLVESGGRKILVDTGWGKKCVRHPLAAVGFGMWFASEPVLSADETLERWLFRLGICSRELDAVILTHLDVDHVSGLRDVADAKHIYASAEELAQANSGDLRYNRRLWRGVDIQALPMSDDPDAPFGRSCDLYGDESVKIMLTPGHSAGSSAVVVRSGDKFAVLAGDDGYNSDSWDKLTLPGIMFDRDGMLRSLQWVRDMRAYKNCVGIFAAHDPAVEPGAFSVV